MDYARERDAKRKAGYAKLHARIEATRDAIVKALTDAGAKVEPRARGSTMDHDRAASIDVKGTSRPCVIEAMLGNNGGYYSNGPKGDEPLVFKIGNYGGLRIRSAKDDPDLTGARLPRIVEAVLADIEKNKAQRESEKRRMNNESASTKIAVRLNKDADRPLRYRAVSSAPDKVLLVFDDLEVTEDEARDFTMALMPLLAKVEKRRNKEFAK